ncbi:MAG: heme exporter protein CcmD [Gammaproteobacteria bacterium]|nr:heme exporter protein CcmD [Gammaproteobacteria bacterium]
MNGSEFSWSEFLHMGGYATFVWSSYGLALVMVVFNIVSPMIERKRVIARVKRAIKREANSRQTS